MASTHAMITRSEKITDNEDIQSQMSLVSRTSTTSSAAKVQAVMDLAASKQALAYGHAIAAKRRELAALVTEKENELALLDAEKTAAIAQAKVLAIDQLISEENAWETHLSAPDAEHTRQHNQHTQAWVNSVTDAQHIATTGSSANVLTDYSENTAILRKSLESNTCFNTNPNALQHTTIPTTTNLIPTRNPATYTDHGHKGLPTHTDITLPNPLGPLQESRYNTADWSLAVDGRQETVNTVNIQPTQVPYAGLPLMGSSLPDTPYVKYMDELRTRGVTMVPYSAQAVQHNILPHVYHPNSVVGEVVQQKYMDQTYSSGQNVRQDKAPLHSQNSNRVETQPSGKVASSTHTATATAMYTSPAIQATECTPIGVSSRQGDATSTNNTDSHQLANILARQNLPRCEPDVFDRDVTMYFPWKSSFQMMLHNTGISPSQQLIYLRNFTKGRARSVVDSFSRRLYTDSQDALTDVWRALDTRFGNVAGITNAHLEQLDRAARFNERDTEKLQHFADTCANVDSQLVCLPGLASLNFPNVLHPIINKLPCYLRNKWEKIVSEYAESHNDAYPTFHVFCEMITSQCRRKNHPNIQVHTMDKSSRSRSPFSDESYPYTDGHDTTRVLKSAANVNPSTKVNPKEPVVVNKYCPIHDSPNHDLRTCYVFNTSTLEKKTEFLRQTGICSRCLIGEHDAKDCSVDITCSKCLSKMHSRQLHIDVSSGTRPTSVHTACTRVCGGNSGDISCSKILLLDVYLQNAPNSTRRIYALLDDQSNVSLVNSKLVDDLNLEEKQEKYNLSTCLGKNIATFGRRIHGLVVRSVVHGTEYALPSLLECDFIPNDKREVATPEMAKQFSHLSHIVREIPPYDANAEIVMIIGRDAPEMLKIREFRNGPVGAPWAQKHLLGWTISGQACPDQVQKISQDHAHDNTIHIKPMVNQHTDDTDTHSQNNEVTSDNSVVATSQCKSILTLCENAMSTPYSKRQSSKQSMSIYGTISPHVDNREKLHTHIACGGIVVFLLLLITNPLVQVSPVTLKTKLPLPHVTDENTNVLLRRENPLHVRSIVNWRKWRRDVTKSEYISTHRSLLRKAVNQTTISHIELSTSIADQNGESCEQMNHMQHTTETTRPQLMSTFYCCEMCRTIPVTQDATQQTNLDSSPLLMTVNLCRCSTHVTHMVTLHGSSRDIREHSIDIIR